MISLLTTKTRQSKLIDVEGKTHPSEPFKQFTIKELDINEATEFSTFLETLTPKQTLCYGLLNDSSSRSLKNIREINNPWIAFDGDYIINNEELTPQLLFNLDPQLANCRYVQRNSSSNITPSNNLHKKKIWFQFHTSNQEEITKYVEIMFTRAIINHYGAYLISQSQKSYATYLRTVFDTAVFSPERIWNEASPTIQSTSHQHNTNTVIGEGNMVEPTKVHPLSPPELSLYYQIKEQLKEAVQPAISERKQNISANYPNHYKKLQASKDQILTTSLTTSTNEEMDAQQIITDHLANNTKETSAFKDPQDPEYGDNKAKLFYNPTSIKLHSFAHGSQTYTLAIPIMNLFDIITVPKKSPSLTPQVKFKALKTIKDISYYLFIDDPSSLNIIVDELSYLSSKTTLRNIFKTNSISLTQYKLKNSSLMAQYSLLNRKDAPWVTFDEDEGLIFISREGMKALMANKIKGVSGAEIHDEFLNSENRKDVTGFGLYPLDNAPPNKLNLWAGFNAYELPEQITEADIQPYIELARLVINSSNEEDLHTFMMWRADMLQDPLRKEGGRPGFAVKGDKGIGKSFEQERIGDFFYPFNVIYARAMDQLVGKHNAEQAYCVYIIAEELNMGMGSIPGAKDAVKALLTASKIRVEPKGIDAVNVPNHMHLALSTNHAEAVLQDSDDRRWTIFKMSPAKRRDKKYFGGFKTWWDNGGKNKVFTYLMNYEYDKHDAMEGRLTGEGKEERILGFWNLDAWVYHLLQHAIDDTIIKTSSEWHKIYCIWFSNEYGDKREPSSLNKFGAELNKQGVIIKRSNERVLSRDKARKSFEDKFFEGAQHDWLAEPEVSSIEDKELPNVS